jgi:Kef-type K+ transport system membrane component KefB/nucleotide-binding universal stress UspA family protein
MEVPGGQRPCLRAWALAFSLGLAALALGAGRAAAADGDGAPSEAVFLAQLVVLMAAGRLLGEAMLRVGQSAVMGQLLAGILLGPSVLGWLWPDLQHLLFPAAKVQKSMLDAVAQFGILLLLLLTGMGTDLKLVQKVGRAAISVSLVGVALPFACGVTLGELVPETLLPDPGKRLLTSLFLGTALSISSIKIVAAVVSEMNFTRRNLGQIIVASAIMEDTIGWIIIAITLGLAQAGTIDLSHVARTVLGTALFLVASFTVGRRLVYWLIRWANDHFESDFPVITMILVIMGVMALATQAIGVHTVLGAFVAGVLIGESPILSRHIDEQLRGLIFAFFMPVFFGVAGLSADLTVLKEPSLQLMTLALIAIASIGKFAGAFVGGKIGGLKRAESLALASAMNARGSTEVIVATIGLSMGALSQSLFTMIVAMAIATTTAMPPMLRWALRRVPLTKAEKERLLREEREAKGFVPNLERLLVAADDSPNGKFASRLAGVLAGPRGLPITVLPLSSNGGKEARGGSAAEEKTANREVVEKTAKVAAEDKARAPEDTPGSVDVTVRKGAGKSKIPSDEAVAREAKKGYDLLLVGLENSHGQSGSFHEDVNRVAAAFDRPLAIVVANGVHLKDPIKSPLRILVPLNGTDVSRRAAEVAIAIGRISDAPITALYVSNLKSGPRKRGVLRTRGHKQAMAILKDAVDLADRHRKDIRTRVRSDVAPDQAVLAEAARHNLIIMGVSRRPGDELFFGETAAGIFENSPASVVFLAS